jgi:transposase
VVLNKQEKEQLVIKLYQEGKPIRQIAQQTHLSFGTIGKIVRRINGQDEDETVPNDLASKSKQTQALSLFLHGKRPVEVAIELDLSSTEVENILQEYWVLTNLDELALVYLEIKSHLDLFLRLFHQLKKSKLTNQKDIKMILNYADDLPSLESKFRSLANTVLDLEIKKKELSTQLIDLAQVINRYQIDIDNKKEQLMKTNVYISKLAIRHDKSKSNKILESNIL